MTYKTVGRRDIRSGIDHHYDVRSQKPSAHSKSNRNGVNSDINFALQGTYYHIGESNNKSLDRLQHQNLQEQTLSLKELKVNSSQEAHHFA